MIKRPGRLEDRLTGIESLHEKPALGALGLHTSEPIFSRRAHLQTAHSHPIVRRDGRRRANRICKQVNRPQFGGDVHEKSPTAAVSGHVAVHRDRCTAPDTIHINRVSAGRRCRVNLEPVEAVRSVQALVGLTVAVVVQSVVYLGRPGMDGRVVVVAVAADRGIARGFVARLGGGCRAVAVTVVVLVVGDLDAFVDRSVAVVVRAVAGLGSRDASVPVIAVAADRGVSSRPRAGLNGVIGAVPVTVVVLVVGGRDAFVGVAVTVVVRAVADLDRDGVDVRIVVIAVAGVAHIACGRGAAGGGAAQGAIFVPVRVAVPGPDFHVVIYHAIAVVVHAIALL